MKNRIEEMKVGKVNIIGSSTINHTARIELGLNCSEYVLMDYVQRSVDHKRSLDVVETYKQTGFGIDEQTALLKTLVLKGFIFPEVADPPFLTGKWLTVFTDVEREFNELFWKLDGKVFWTGSKKKSYGMYYKLRKEYSKEFMIEARDDYARLLKAENDGGFDRRVMMAERWLLKANEYYLVDWKGLAEQRETENTKNRYKMKKTDEKPEKSESVTADQRHKSYEQDRDQ